MNQFDFTGICKVTMSHEKGTPKSKHVSTDFRLEISKNLDRKVYLDEDELPTKNAIKPLDQCFIQGLVGTIHKAHEEGWWDSADHLRYIICEIERGFAEVSNVSKGVM